MPRSRRKTSQASKTGIVVESCYCRKCMQSKNPSNFYDAVDNGLIDSSGYMSICKPCLNDLYDRFYESEHSVEKAILRLCRAINLKYSEEAVQAAIGQFQTYKERGSDPTSMFGLYKSKLYMFEGRSSSKIETHNVDLQYTETTQITISDKNTFDNFDSSEIDHDVISYWGEGRGTKDYEWLEKTLDNWKRTHKCDTTAEETLLREIVFKQFEIENARKSNGSTAALVKELQEIMKTANVDPAKAALANSGKAQETFSSFIKMVEENRPAEYYKDKSLFKDFDNIGPKYFMPYVQRPMKNFITGSRDFNLETENDEDDDGLAEGIIDNAESEE